MKIVIVGSGYVGLTSGVCFSVLGHDITCVDVDDSVVKRLNAGEVTIYEPGLDTLLAKALDAGRFRATLDCAAALEQADIAFICVGTPTLEHGLGANLDYVHAAARTCLNHLPQNSVMVIKSTVPLGTGAKLLQLRDEMERSDISIASNPEFLREGSAVTDFMKPDRIVIGVREKQAEDALREAYAPLTDQGNLLIATNVQSAELGKYAANAFLATKITFANQLARVCCNSGASMDEIRNIMGSDARISPQFLQQGPGYGGSCFPKDTRALLIIGEEYNAPQRLVEAVISQNEILKAEVAHRLIEEVADLDTKVVGLFGLTFKENTDDMRDAPSLTVVEQLLGKVKRLIAFDPMFHPSGPAPISGVELMDSVDHLLGECDILIVLNRYSDIDISAAATVKGLAIYDYRSVFSSNDNIFVFGEPDKRTVG